MEGAEHLPFAHVDGHRHQDGGEGGQRHALGKGRRDQDDQQQDHRVDHARDRGQGSALDVGGGAGDGAGGGDAAEQTAREVRDALRHQFLIGVVAVPGHFVGHHRA